jgi:uncharacterized Ntn-hydrolase superfamily protein
VTSARTGTYSIVARDADTGALGVAVQSHWFSVGSLVSWGRPGVGVVATQSIVEPAYGPRLLDRLEADEEPKSALSALVADDDAARFRQVAVVDAAGAIAVHTGDGCIEHAGHLIGQGFSVQANMMASPEVWPAMAEAFSSAEGPLARRLLMALEAAEGAGGDVRGRQSAALLVVPAEGEGWRRDVELRVEDDPEPLAELSRLLDLHQAYSLADEGDELAGKGDHGAAADRYRQAAALAPHSEELLFWAGLSLAQGGEVDEGAAAVQRAIDAHQGWRELLLRLDEEIAPSAESVRQALGIGG